MRATSILNRPLFLAVLPALLLVGAVAAQDTFDGRTSAEWSRLLAKDSKTLDSLAAGGAKALPVVRSLLAAADDATIRLAARVCEKMGPTAAPATPGLLRGLRTSKKWWTRLYCASALGEIGKPDPAVLDALVDGLQSSLAAHLRQVCARALWKLDRGASARVLTEFGRGRISEHRHAVDALVWSGEQNIPALVDALGGEDRSTTKVAGVARDALLRIGWLSVPALERAGHGKLAQEVLRRGPLEHVRYREDFIPKWTEKRQAITGFVTLRWETCSGHGGGLSLYRARENKRGFLIERIELEGPTISNRRPHAVAVRFATIPRTRALALTRQLLVLSGLSLVEKDPDSRSFGGSTGDFHARMRIDFAGKSILDEHWAGYPGTQNTPDRCRVQAGRAILREAMQGAKWQTRKPTADDLERVEQRIAHPVAAQKRWVSKRLKIIVGLMRKAIEG